MTRAFLVELWHTVICFLVRDKWLFIYFKAIIDLFEIVHEFLSNSRDMSRYGISSSSEILHEFTTQL